MKSYFRGEHSLVRCICVWGLSYPLALFIIIQLLTVLHHPVNFNVEQWIYSNNILAFYLQEYILASLAFIYFPMAIISAISAKPIPSHPKWTYFIRHSFIILSAVMAIFIVNLIQQTRDVPLNFRIMHSPINYSVHWYFIGLFALLVYRNICVKEKPPILLPPNAAEKKEDITKEIEL